MGIETVAVIGLGVIGGSLARSLKKRMPGLRIHGIDTSAMVVEEARKEGLIDLGSVNPCEGVREADLVFLATPMSAMTEICREIGPVLKNGAIVTDVGSTKANVVHMMESLLPPGVFYIGGHPMAGSEKRGLEGSSDILFENAAYVLTPRENTPAYVIKTMEEVAQGLGARVVFLTPEEHDQKVAAVSHLPHIVASALVNTVGSLEEKRQGYLALAAGGFRDTTRIAASQSEMWCDILLHNREALVSLLEEYISTLRQYRNALRDHEAVSLLELLEGARCWRQQVPMGMKSLIPELYELTVMVPDQPGAIAEITQLLAKGQLSIIDIEIQRVREEGEGTLRLGFTRDDWRNRAVSLLVQHGYKAERRGK